MSSVIVVPEGFSYVGGALLSTIYLLAWQTMRVGSARKRAGIDYPYLYAEKADADVRHEAKVFNCTQRAHQNTLEALPVVLTGTLLTGIKYPYVAAALCGAFTLSRIMYTIGYSSGNPKQRSTKGGSAGMLVLLGLIGASSYTVVNFIRAGL